MNLSRYERLDSVVGVTLVRPALRPLFPRHRGCSCQRRVSKTVQVDTPVHLFCSFNLDEPSETKQWGALALSVACMMMSRICWAVANGKTVSLTHCNTGAGRRLTSCQFLAAQVSACYECHLATIPHRHHYRMNPSASFSWGIFSIQEAPRNAASTCSNSK